MAYTTFMSESAGVPQPPKQESWNVSAGRLVQKRIETIRQITEAIDSGEKSDAYIADAEITIKKLFESIEELQKERVQNIVEKGMESSAPISAHEVEKLLRRVRKGEMKREDMEAILKDDSQWSYLFPQPQPKRIPMREQVEDKYPGIAKRYEGKDWGLRNTDKIFYFLLDNGAFSRDTAKTYEEIYEKVYDEKQEGVLIGHTKLDGGISQLRTLLRHSKNQYELITVSEHDRHTPKRYFLKQRGGQANYKMRESKMPSESDSFEEQLGEPHIFRFIDTGHGINAVLFTRKESVRLQEFIKKKGVSVNAREMSSEYKLENGYKDSDRRFTFFFPASKYLPANILAILEEFAKADSKKN